MDSWMKDTSTKGKLHRLGLLSQKPALCKTMSGKVRVTSLCLHRCRSLRGIKQNQEAAGSGQKRGDAASQCEHMGSSCHKYWMLGVVFGRGIIIYLPCIYTLSSWDVSFFCRRNFIIFFTFESLVRKIMPAHLLLWYVQTICGVTGVELDVSFSY